MRLNRIIITLLLLSAALVANAQTVSGTVTDAATGETLIGATVLDVGSGKGTVTNAYGRYTLTLKGSSTVELKISTYQYFKDKQHLEGTIDRYVKLF